MDWGPRKEALFFCCRCRGPVLDGLKIFSEKVKIVKNIHYICIIF